MQESNKEQSLEWPISEDLIGRKVRFDGYSNGSHTHWNFKPNELYVIGKDGDGNIGPINKAGTVPMKNWGFKFTLLPKESEEWPEERQGRCRSERKRWRTLRKARNDARR